MIYPRAMMHYLLFVLFVLVVDSVDKVFVNELRAPPLVTIDVGQVMGTMKESNTGKTVYQYLGIPYAEPPIDTLRFEPPVPVGKFQSTIEAIALKPSCIQVFTGVWPLNLIIEYLFNQGNPPESEDCLYVNVYTPENRFESIKPVMVWLYGGGNEFGSATNPIYDGTNIAGNQDVVVVTFNYRTNIFGFPLAPQLPITGQNLGYLDQRLVLDWVQRNIHAFGGDPKQVTLFGESAGSGAIDYLVTSQITNTSFRAAILESGVSGFNKVATVGGTSWKQITEKVGCKEPTGSPEQLQCMKKIDAKKLKNVQEKDSLAFGNVIDNYTVFQNLEARRQAGYVAKIPLLIGENFDEGTLVSIFYKNLTSFWESVLGKDVATKLMPQIHQLYPVPSIQYPNDQYAIDASARDYIFGCPISAVASDDAKATGQPVWRYVYNVYFPNQQPIPGLRAYHSSEIFEIFGTYQQHGATQQQIELSNFMQTAWANFAKNPSAGPGWNDISTGTLGELGANGTSGVINTPLSTFDFACNFWLPLEPKS